MIYVTSGTNINIYNTQSWASGFSSVGWVRLNSNHFTPKWIAVFISHYHRLPHHILSAVICILWIMLCQWTLPFPQSPLGAKNDPSESLNRERQLQAHAVFQLRAPVARIEPYHPIALHWYYQTRSNIFVSEWIINCENLYTQTYHVPRIKELISWLPL